MLIHNQKKGAEKENKKNHFYFNKINLSLTVLFFCFISAIKLSRNLVSFFGLDSDYSHFNPIDPINCD